MLGAGLMLQLWLQHICMDLITQGTSKVQIMWFIIFFTFSMYFIFLTLFYIDTHIHMTAWPIHPELGMLEGGSK
jgi:hypothetical protein